MPDNTTPGADWLTVPEAALVLRVCTKTLRSWLRSGKLPAKRWGRQWRIRRSDLS